MLKFILVTTKINFHTLAHKYAIHSTLPPLWLTLVTSVHVPVSSELSRSLLLCLFQARPQGWRLPSTPWWINWACLLVVSHGSHSRSELRVFWEDRLLWRASKSLEQIWHKIWMWLLHCCTWGWSYQSHHIWQSRQDCQSGHAACWKWRWLQFHGGPIKSPLWWGDKSVTWGWMEGILGGKA